MKALLNFLLLELNKGLNGEQPYVNWDFGGVLDEMSESREASLPNGKMDQRACLPFQIRLLTFSHPFPHTPLLNNKLISSSLL